MGYGIQLVMLFAPFVIFALFAASWIIKFWQDSKQRSGLFHLTSAWAGLIASIVSLAAVILIAGGLIAGYDTGAGGAFNPGPNNWGMNTGLALAVMVAPIVWLTFGVLALLSWWFGESRVAN